MKFVTHFDPCLDRGGVSNVPRKPLLMRRMIAATRCRLFGHTLHTEGYANAHRFSWVDWRIGNYRQCKHCQARIFDLASAEQRDTVLAIERGRWEDHFAQEARQSTSD